jgi:ribosomal protein S24E
MDLKLIKEKEIPLLSRKRYTYLTDNKGVTPSRLDFLKEISEKLKVDKGLVVIKHIYPQYGSDKVKVMAHVYKNQKDKEKFEHSSLINKHHKKTKAEEEQEEKEKAEKEAEAQKKKEEAEAAKQELKEEAEEKAEEASQEEPKEEKGEEKKEEAEDEKSKSDEDKPQKDKK